MHASLIDDVLAIEYGGEVGDQCHKHPDEDTKTKC